MRLQETHPQRKQREFRPCRPKTGVFRQTPGNASNAGSPANRGVQGKEKPNRDFLGLVDMVVQGLMRSPRSARLEKLTRQEVPVCWERQRE
jgi:hypothetical protein